MGKVRTDSIKRTAGELVSKYSNEFGIDFEANKGFLNSLGLEMTKKMRNKVVGYITQLKKIEAQVSKETREVEIPLTET